jgi:hypothetical protein
MEFLAYLFVAPPFIIAFLLAVGAVVLLWALASTPTAGAAWVLVATSLEAAFVLVPPIHLGINIFLGDLVSVFLALALVMRARHYPWASAIGRAWLVFGLFMFASFVLGTAKYGVRAGSDFRTYFFYFWVGISYFLTFEMSPVRLQRIRSVYIAAAIFIVALSCIRWMALLGHLDLGPFQAYVPDGKTLRVVTAGQAMIIVVGAMFLLHRWLLRESGFGVAALAAVMLLVVVALQHRSVWVAGLLGLMGLVVFQRQQLGRGGGAVLWLIVGLIAALLPLLLLGVGSDVQQSVGGSVQEGLSSRSTFVSRVEGWRNLLAEWRAGGISGYAIGQPFGSGYVRAQQGSLVTWSPHNYYVQVLLRTGVVGLAAMLFAFVAAAVRLFKTRDVDGARWAPLLLAMVLLELAFFVPYPALFDQAIFCGMALAVAARRAARPVTVGEAQIGHAPLGSRRSRAMSGLWRHA